MHFGLPSSATHCEGWYVQKPKGIFSNRIAYITYTLVANHTISHRGRIDGNFSAPKVGVGNATTLPTKPGYGGYGGEEWKSFTNEGRKNAARLTYIHVDVSFSQEGFDRRKMYNPR
ncbi:uncharacterized protein LAJ45_00016 [Morchella importuna]|uniref:uncharacterized protein n=1 Tax=Morchella importuna TaxID=1174673 RepID=UPI001E8D40AE|nr:uncharacterized protein LAJ45_00016 [Morchella importuna]KAH8155008.1 hypothetical protein LAJ45_00016 [Morchella importuna]